MTHLPEIWAVLKGHLRRGTWVHITQIYDLVERHIKLDDDDYEPQCPGSSIPKWKRNARNVLQYRKSRREILWDGAEKYMMP